VCCCRPACRRCGRAPLCVPCGLWTAVGCFSSAAFPCPDALHCCCVYDATRINPGPVNAPCQAHYSSRSAVAPKKLITPPALHRRCIAADSPHPPAPRVARQREAARERQTGSDVSSFGSFTGEEAVLLGRSGSVCLGQLVGLRATMMLKQLDSNLPCVRLLRGCSQG